MVNLEFVACVEPCFLCIEQGKFHLGIANLRPSGCEQFNPNTKIFRIFDQETYLDPEQLMRRFESANKKKEKQRQFSLFLSVIELN